MKGCSDYTEEAKNWIKDPKKKEKNKRPLSLLLLAAVVVVAVVALWPHPPEEEFVIAAQREQATDLSAQDALQEAAKQDEASAKSAEKDKTMVVYITGAVKTPGVYELKENDRVNDVITLAGGLVKGSASEYINLAAPIQDGIHVHIPFESEIESGKAEQIAAQGAAGSTASSNLGMAGEAKERLVNLNTATASELETLSGIGPATSAKIIDYREKNGPFKTIADLKNVSGIGDKKFEDLADKVCV